MRYASLLARLTSPVGKTDGSRCRVLYKSRVTSINHEYIVVALVCSFLFQSRGELRKISNETARFGRSAVSFDDYVYNFLPFAFPISYKVGVSR